MIYEVERKFLLKDLPKLEYEKIFLIHQYYLENDEGYSDRVRKTDDGNKCKYTRTKKRFISSQKVNEEVETDISKKEFLKLKKKSHSIIVKYRHIFTDHENNRWEIDKFENVNLIIGEIESVTDDEHLEDVMLDMKSQLIPKFIADNLIMEVTDFKPFSNKRLSKTYKETTKEIHKS